MYNDKIKMKNKLILINLYSSGSYSRGRDIVKFLRTQVLLHLTKELRLYVCLYGNLRNVTFMFILFLTYVLMDKFLSLFWLVIEPILKVRTKTLIWKMQLTLVYKKKIVMQQIYISNDINNSILQYWFYGTSIRILLPNWQKCWLEFC